MVEAQSDSFKNRLSGYKKKQPELTVSPRKIRHRFRDDCEREIHLSWGVEHIMVRSQVCKKNREARHVLNFVKSSMLSSIDEYKEQGEIPIFECLFPNLTNQIHTDDPEMKKYLKTQKICLQVVGEALEGIAAIHWIEQSPYGSKINKYSPCYHLNERFESCMKKLKVLRTLTSRD